MFLYFSIFLLTFFLLVFMGKKNNLPISITFFMLFLLYGCRDYGGVDDTTYIEAFEGANNGTIVYGMEKSFLIISRVLGEFGLNYKSVFLLYALVSFIFTYLSYKRLCKNRYEWLIALLGFLVFALVPTITVMRQFAAAAILAYAFTLRFEKRNKSSLVLIGLATLIHVGSSIGFFVFLLIPKRFSVTTKIIIPLIGLVIGYSGILAGILKIVQYIVPDKYTGYLSNSNTTSPDVGILHLILITVYILQFILPAVFKMENVSNRSIEFLQVMQMIYFLMYFSTLASGWASRVSLYFVLFVPFIFKTFISIFKLETDRKLIYWTCYGAYTLLFIYQIMSISDSSNLSGLIPYEGSFNFWK